jgi:hypothetical protein
MMKKDKLDQKEIKEFNHQKLFYGPRRKTLDTYCLESICYALLDKDTEIKSWLNKEKHRIVEIDKQRFNLTEILKGVPDFEHISFTEPQLDAYLELFEYRSFLFGVPAPKKPAYLHPAERLALYFWSRNFLEAATSFGAGHEQSYELMQSFLRSFASCNIPLSFLLTICVASHGLSKIPPAKNHVGAISYRCEKEGNFLEARKKAAETGELVTDPGFISSNLNNPLSHFGQFVTEIYQEPSINPIGKNIQGLSAYGSTIFQRETEVLFPPKTEFKHSVDQKTGNLIAIPVRSINKEKEKKGCNLEVTPEVLALNVRLKLKNLYIFLKNKKIENTHSEFKKFFDTVDNSKKIACIQLAINRLDELFRQKEPIINKNIIEALISTIKEAIRENQKLSNASWCASWATTHDILFSALKIVQELHQLVPEEQQSQVITMTS